MVQDGSPCVMKGSICRTKVLTLTCLTMDERACTVFARPMSWPCVELPRTPSGGIDVQGARGIASGQLGHVRIQHDDVGHGGDRLPLAGQCPLGRTLGRG